MQYLAHIINSYRLTWQKISKNALLESLKIWVWLLKISVGDINEYFL